MKTAVTLLAVAMSLPSLRAASPGPVSQVGAPLPPPGVRPPPPPATLPPPPNPPGRAVADAGRFSLPLPSLSVSEKADFDVGKAEFLAVETPEGGLGPVFNDVSCVACHFQGGAGGFSRVTVTRFGKLVNGVFDPLVEKGGSLLQKRATSKEFLETIPAEANVVALRLTTPLFGAGLLEAIPDAVILAQETRTKVDGVKGRAARILDPASGQTRVGRFGWKAQHATLDGFAADAYLNEMGVTNRLFPKENAPNGNALLLAKADQVLDPEDAPAEGKADFNLAADFMRLLAPVPPMRPSAQINAGSLVFAQVGCAACHVPVLKTGPSPIAALANREVFAYSDLLLHDMGRLGDGIEQPPAKGNEMRTAPLWGLRLRDRYLHDGRASTLDLAIQAHEGEAAVARERFRKLDAAKRTALLAFLNSL